MIQPIDELLSQLRPVTGPESVPQDADSWRWIWPVLAIALTLVLIGRLLLRRRTIALIPPADEALAALDRLPVVPSADALREMDHLGRRFLGRVHGFAADRMTSAELLRTIPSDESSAWSAIFSQIEPGRFSGRPLTTEEWGSLIQQVRPLIRIVRTNLADQVVQRS